ncbi:MAG: response regulator [Dysgonamonadaceae bacterium]|jgi:signal transduction histidine kinase/ligand-binding sensor domain-containing protein/DNA-binding response OmpR family regulator|nr:response regulator [Dysgonamonadaceae bacterium]
MKRLKTTVLWAMCLLWIAHPVLAIDILRFEWISDRDGLSQNTVRCIIQDNKGFIWLGTVNGLNRYNGKEFFVMLPKTGNFTSLPDNRIRSMQEDRNGYIWIRTTANIFCCYDPRTERFVDYDPNNRQKNFTHVRTFSNGDVWLWGSSGGCCRVRHTAGNLQSLRFGEAELGSLSALFVHEDASHRIWISSDKGLFRIEGDHAVSIVSESFFSVIESENRLFFINSNHIVPFDLRQQKFDKAVVFPNAKTISLNMTTSLNEGLILLATKEDILAFDSRKMKFIPVEPLFDNQPVKNASFYMDQKGNKWVYNVSGVLWRHFPDNHFEKLNLIPPDILSAIDAERYEIYHDSRNIIWITTYGNGLFALDQNNQQICHYTVNNSDLPTNYLLCVTEDKSGEIWVGTELAGISKISLSNYPVQILYPEPKKNNNRSNAVRLIYEDSRGRFWMGTRSGDLHIYDSSFKKLKSHNIQGGLPFAATEDLDGNVWLGTRGNGILVFPPSAEKPIRHYRLHDIERQPTNSNNVFDLLRDSQNRIWVASFGGGLHYADLNEKEITFRHISTRTVNQDMVRAIMQDHTGMIWTGTNEGVNVFDPNELVRDNTKYINFHFDVNDDRSINNNEVKAIFEDSQGRIWFGTTGGGLNLLVRETPLERSWFQHFTAKEGLSNEVIQAIMEDDQGFIWVSTEGGSGISRLNQETGRFENFSLSDSKRSGLFNEGARWKMKNGNLIFGSYFGAFIFDPSQIKSDAYAPPVVITGLKINGVDVYPEQPNSPLSESISLTNAVRLKYNQNSFNIEFAMLNFHSSTFNQYAYYLDGYEKLWNPVTRHNIAAYRNVPPGTYWFKVKGSNSFGVWTDHETALKIVVAPPFWQSVWAYLLYLVIIIVAILFTIRIIKQINRLHTEVEVERQLTEYKLRFFTNISHEFRTPLTIIRGSIENLAILENLPATVAKQVDQMSKSASRLLRLIDQLLEFRKLQNKGLELQLARTEAVAFFHDIYQTFQELAEKKKIEFLFESNRPQQEMLLDKSKWDKIVYNLLSNAMKYTPDNGLIVMRLIFSEADDRFILSVSDNGAGVPKEKQSSLFVRFAQFDSSVGGTGVGLHLTAELAATHKGKIEYADSQWGGACFTVTVPLSDDNYRNEVIEETQPASKWTHSVEERSLTADLPEPFLPDKQYKAYKLLVIEDDYEVREFIFNQLTDSFSVIAAKDGTEGLEKAIQEQPNLIVCDVMMPGVDGFEVTRRLKDDFLTSHIPIVLLTAHSSEEHRLEGIQAGADAYITKPFSIKYLMVRIIKLIEQREKLQRKFAQEPGRPVLPINVTDKDQAFIDKIHHLIERNIADIDFSVDTFAQTAGMGRTNFYKKVKGLTGHSPNEYLRIIRMKKAAELLTTTDLNVSEVSYKVGINDPFYFSKCFKAQFGKSPSQFQKSKIGIG